MPQYQAYAPDVQVGGVSILGCLGGLEKAGLSQTEGLELLAASGVTDIVPEGWYSQQAYLDMFRQIEARHGEGALQTMARQIPDKAKFPPGIKNLEQALQTLDFAYQMNHRNGPIGHYACLPLSPRALEMVCENPYGCAFDLGLLEALIEQFKVPESQPYLRHLEGTPCRRNGEESCTYYITW